MKNVLPQKIIFNNKNLVEKKDIAHQFNKYFVNIGPDLAKNIPSSDTSFEEYLSVFEGEMQNVCISLDDLKKSFTTLKRNKAPGYDDVTSNTVLSVSNEITVPLYHCVKLSFEKGIFPNKLKVCLETKLTLIEKVIAN